MIEDQCGCQFENIPAKTAIIKIDQDKIAILAQDIFLAEIGVDGTIAIAIFRKIVEFPQNSFIGFLHKLSLRGFAKGTQWVSPESIFSD